MAKIPNLFTPLSLVSVGLALAALAVLALFVSGDGKIGAQAGIWTEEHAAQAGDGHIPAVFPQFERGRVINQRAVTHVIEYVLVGERAIGQPQQERFEFGQTCFAGVMFKDALDARFAKSKGQAVKIAEVGNQFARAGPPPIIFPVSSSATFWRVACRIWL